MARIAPSILSADFAALGAAVNSVASEADLLHVDVMDGHFVPNLTIGPPVVKCLRTHTDLYLDCHLMMENPGDFLEAFREAGADGCSVHIEIGDTQSLINEMRALNLDAGIAVNPDTPFEAFEPFLDQIDLLVIMSVFPGFAAQRFIAGVLPKLKQARNEIDRRNLTVAIEVDGGIDVSSAPTAAEAGASVFVAGNAIFGQSSPLQATKNLRSAIEKGQPVA